MEIQWVSFLAYPNRFGNKGFEEEEEDLPQPIQDILVIFLGWGQYYLLIQFSLPFCCTLAQNYQT
jgi:hypothetical protein